MSSVKSKVDSYLEDYYVDEILIISTEMLRWDLNNLVIPSINIAIEAKNMIIIG